MAKASSSALSLKTHLGQLGDSDSLLEEMGENDLEAIDAKLEEQQICGSKHCPRCGHNLDGKPDWLGLPAGVKFDPTDQELVEHLEAKVEAKAIKSHPLIDEFIPTIEGEDGICYTHPEKFPGVTRDGLIRHFFHRPSKAYTTGTRKRRKIQTECDLRGGETRWHKTGKTRPVMANGKQKGCKKILVLYTNFGKNRKPEKTNWVMHQYHLGLNEEEREGELVVSKIFYQTQPRQCNWSDRSPAIGGGRIDLSGGRDSGSEIFSSKKMTVVQRENMASGGGLAPPVSSFSSLEIPQLKSNQFSFAEFSQGFNEVEILEASIGRNLCEERPHDHVAHNHHHRHHHQMEAPSAFHGSRPSHPISTIISPPPLHQPSIVLDQDSFSLSQILLQNQNFQHQQKHKKESGRCASGLEELIRGCTSSSIKQESSSTTTRQETEWMKFPSFWPDTDNPNHHG